MADDQDGPASDCKHTGADDGTECQAGVAISIGEQPVDVFGIVFMAVEVVLDAAGFQLQEQGRHPSDCARPDEAPPRDRGG